MAARVGDRVLDGRADVGGGLRAGHAEPAEDVSAARHDAVRRWTVGTAAGGAYGGARPALRERVFLHWPDEREGSGHDAVSGDHAGAGARTIPLQRLLPAVPLACW